MTTLNTQDFKDSYNALNKFKYPLSHDNKIAYVALAALLEVCTNARFGIVQIQKLLDEKTNECKTELENFESVFEKLVNQ